MKIKAILSLSSCVVAVYLSAQGFPPTPPTTGYPPPIEMRNQPIGPAVKAELISTDKVIARTGTVIVRRTSTNWFNVTRKVGEATASAPVTVPLYSQEGSVTETVLAHFSHEGTSYSFSLSAKLTAQLLRYYRLDGTNMVLLSNVVTNPLP